MRTDFMRAEGVTFEVGKSTFVLRCLAEPKTLPLKPKEFQANIAAVAKGEPPPHVVTANMRMYFERTRENTIKFRFANPNRSLDKRFAARAPVIEGYELSGPDLLYAQITQLCDAITFDPQTTQNTPRVPTARHLS